MPCQFCRLLCLGCIIICQSCILLCRLRKPFRRTGFLFSASRCFFRAGNGFLQLIKILLYFILNIVLNSILHLLDAVLHGIQILLGFIDHSQLQLDILFLTTDLIHHLIHLGTVLIPAGSDLLSISGKSVTERRCLSIHLINLRIRLIQLGIDLAHPILDGWLLCGDRILHAAVDGILRNFLHLLLAVFADEIIRQFSKLLLIRFRQFVRNAGCSLFLNLDLLLFSGEQEAHYDQDHADHKYDDCSYSHGISP